MELTEATGFVNYVDGLLEHEFHFVLTCNIYVDLRQKYIPIEYRRAPSAHKFNRLTSAFRKLSSIYVFSYFPFGFEGRIWDLIVSVPDHCLSFYFL